MRIGKIAERAAEGLFHLVKLIREGTSTNPDNREVQCEGDRDETETGREIWRAARNLGPGGFKHVAGDGEYGLLLDLPWGGTNGIILGIDSDDADAPEPSLAPGESAMLNTADSSGKSIVRCVSSRVEIGITTGGLIVRKDKTSTWWNTALTGPRAVFGGHPHGGVMAGPGQSGPPVAPNHDLGDIGDIGSDDDHRVK